MDIKNSPRVGDSGDALHNARRSVEKYTRTMPPGRRNVQGRKSSLGLQSRSVRQEGCGAAAIRCLLADARFRAVVEQHAAEDPTVPEGSDRLAHRSDPVAAAAHAEHDAVGR